MKRPETGFVPEEATMESDNSEFEAIEQQKNRAKTGRELMEEEKNVPIIGNAKKIHSTGKISMGEQRNIYLAKEFSGQKVVELPDNLVAVVKDNNGKFEIEAIFELGQNEKGQKSSERIEIAEAKSRSKTLRDAIDQLEEKLRAGYEVELVSEKTEEKELQKIKAKMIEALERNEIITYGADGEIICDLERIKNLEGSIFEGARRFELKKGTIKPSWQKMLLEIFADKKVVSTEDYKKRLEGDRDIEEKSLFYLPKNKEEAFNLEKISQADFYLTISDFLVTEVNKIDPFFQEKFGVGALETEFAVRIYHPKYGAGYRDENGSLFVKRDVRDKNSKFIKISMDWLYSRFNYGYYSGLVRKEILLHTPKIGILDKDFKNLRENRLLTEKDFGQSENTKTSGLFRVEKTIGIKGGTNFGTFYVDEYGEKRFAHAQYTLGTEFEGKRLVKLQENLYGIVDEVEGIKRITHIIKPAEIELIRQKQEEYRKKHHKEPSVASVHFGKRDPNSPKPVLFEATNLSPKREDETPEEYAERIATFNAVREYNKLQQISSDLSKKAGIGIHNLELNEQNALASFAFESNENYRQLIDFSKKFGEKGLKAFLACEYGMNIGNIILELGEKLPTDQANMVFAAYVEVIFSMNQEADQIFEEIRTFNPDIPIIRDEILESLLSRGKDLLVEIHQQLQSKKKGEILEELVIQNFIREIKEETSEQKAVRSNFKKVAEIFNQKEINLESLKKSQGVVLNSLKRGQSSGLLLKTLKRMDKLSPIPEIHWRVDRSLAEYDRRFGLDLAGLLEELALAEEKKILLEFGPGSGLSKRERTAGTLGKKYDDFAMADRLYYPVDSVIARLIDFEKIKKDIGQDLADQEKQVLIEFIYKSVYIKKDQTSLDQFDYNQENIDQINQDPNNLKNILISCGPALVNAEIVPQTISSRDEQGRVIYPNKLDINSQSSAVQKAIRTFAENPAHYLINGYQEADVYDLIDAFPAGTMIGDFSDIKKVKPDESIDVALAVRSTVYLKEDKYVDFLGDVAKALSDEGIYIDDSIRDNDGWYYRLSEIQKFLAENAAKKEKGQIKYNLEVSVVLGPGFPGEDYRQDLVPLALVISKNISYNDQISKYLNAGCRLVNFFELSSDQNYLKTLDSSGLTAQRVETKED